jgi:hypothetical protein
VRTVLVSVLRAQQTGHDEHAFLRQAAAALRVLTARTPVQPLASSLARALVVA